METTAAVCDIDRLPAEILAAIISRTSPPDACRAAGVSRAFHAVADSDAVWSCFLPRDDLPRFTKSELRRAPTTSKKALFVHLSGHPALLFKKYTRMQLDRVTGAKCFTLSAAALQISAHSRSSWDLIHQNSKFKRFSEVVKLVSVFNFEIGARIPCRMLSQNSTYAACLVFKLGSYLLQGPEISFEEGLVCVGGRRAAQRSVTLSTTARDIFGQTWQRDGHSDAAAAAGAGGGGLGAHKHISVQHWSETNTRAVPVGDDVVFPRQRADGWSEVELGEFHVEEDDRDGYVTVALRQARRATTKNRLLVWCVEIRPKAANFEGKLVD